MESVSTRDLKRICKEYYHIGTDNNPLALSILQEKLGVTEFEVERDGSIRLFEKLEEVHTISKTLYEGGVVPTVLHMKEANLEQYYMNMVGGEENVEPDKGAKISNKKR